MKLKVGNYVFIVPYGTYLWHLGRVKYTRGDYTVINSYSLKEKLLDLIPGRKQRQQRKVEKLAVKLFQCNIIDWKDRN